MSKIAKTIIIILIIIALLVLSAVITCRIFIYNQNYTLDFEKITEIDKGQNDNDLYWFTIRDEEYNGFYDVEMLETVSSDINDVYNIDFDYNNYRPRIEKYFI